MLDFLAKVCYTVIIEIEEAQVCDYQVTHLRYIYNQCASASLPSDAFPFLDIFFQSLLS